MSRVSWYYRNSIRLLIQRHQNELSQGSHLGPRSLQILCKLKHSPDGDEDVPSFDLPMILSFCFTFLSWMVGAGRVGFPVPRCDLSSSAAAADAACDCCIALKSFTTDHAFSVHTNLQKGSETYLLAVLLSSEPAHFRLPTRQ